MNRREPPEIEARYTLFMYEDIRAIKQACAELGRTERPHVEAIFQDNAARLIAGILERKEKRSASKRMDAAANQHAHQRHALFQRFALNESSRPFIPPLLAVKFKPLIHANRR